MFLSVAQDYYIDHFCIATFSETSGYNHKVISYQALVKNLNFRTLFIDLRNESIINNWIVLFEIGSIYHILQLQLSNSHRTL